MLNGCVLVEFNNGFILNYMKAVSGLASDWVHATFPCAYTSYQYTFGSTPTWCRVIYTASDGNLTYAKYAPEKWSGSDEDCQVYLLAIGY